MTDRLLSALDKAFNVLEKRNPYHDRSNGRFTSRGGGGGTRVETSKTDRRQNVGSPVKLGTTLASSAKTLLSLDKTGHPLSKANFAVSTLMHRHNVSINDAISALKGHSGLNRRQALNLRDESWRTLKPSTQAYKDATQGTIQRALGGIANLKAGKFIAKNTMFDIDKAMMLDKRTSAKTFAWWAKTKSQNVQTSNMFPASPSSHAVAKEFGLIYNKMKAQLAREKGLQSLNKSGFAADHVKPKSMYMVNSSAVAKYVNRRENFQLMGDSANKAKGGRFFDKTTGKPNWTSLTPGDIKFMTYEALLGHSRYEKKTGKKFIKGGITDAQLAVAKRTRNQTAWRKKHSLPPLKYKEWDL